MKVGYRAGSIGKRAAMCVRKWPVRREPARVCIDSSEFRRMFVAGTTPAARITFVFPSGKHRSPRDVLSTFTTWPSSGSTRKFWATTSVAIMSGLPRPCFASCRCFSCSARSGPGVENLMKERVDVGVVRPTASGPGSA